jgi:hypothetical protein
MKFNLAAAILLGHVDHHLICAQLGAPTNKPAQSRHPTANKPTPSRHPTTNKPTTMFPTRKPTTKKPSTMFPTRKPTQTQLQLWHQVGFDVDGEDAFDESGASLSLSADGKVLAIGALWSSGENGYGSGHVRVYAWNSTIAKYTQCGSDIDGKASSDWFGASVSLSADGKVLAIGAPWNSGMNGYASGHVLVYALNSTSAQYNQRGFDIDSEAAGDFSGYAVSLSADGKVLAIGAPLNDGKNGNGSGHVRVFVWNSNSAKYTRRGSDIDGEAAHDWSGASVSLSADGKVLAIGAPFNNNYSGHVRVYAWDSTSAKYIQRGTDIDGEAGYDESGSISLSADGKVLAIGALTNDGKNGNDSGHVRVFVWNSNSAKYTQRGSDIDGEAAYDWSGESVSLSADGKVLAIGARYNDGKNGTDSGHVRVYAWDSTSAKYTQRGSDIDGEAAYDGSGNAVSLSADGKVLAIGARYNDGKNGNDSGHVRVYAWGN